MTFKFDSDSFPSLGFAEFENPWNKIGLQDLDPGHEQSAMLDFLAAASGSEIVYGDDGSVSIEGVDLADIALVKATDGIVDKVYSGNIFRDAESDRAVLKCGSNNFPVEITFTTAKVGKQEIKIFAATCGNMSGVFGFEENEKKVKIEIDGKEVEVAFKPAWITFSIEGAEEEYRCNLSLKLDTNPTEARVKAAAEAGKLHELLIIPGTGGGGETLKMVDLGEGEFGVKGFREVQAKDGSRTSYVIQLVDGRQCWSRGNCDKAFKDEAMKARLEASFKANEPVCLVVSGIVHKNGKTYASVAFRFRPAKVEVEPPAPGSVKIKPVVEPPAQPKKELTAVGAGTDAPGYDEIPF